MSELKNYLEALRAAVGEEKFALARVQLKIAAEFLSPKKRLELENAKNNQDRREKLDDWFGNFLAPEIKNTIAVLGEHRTLSLIDELGPAEKLKAPEIVVSAPLTLSEKQKSQFSAALLENLGSDSIIFQKDPSLIGGVKIRVGDREIDFSIKNQISHLFT